MRFAAVDWLLSTQGHRARWAPQRTYETWPTESNLSSNVNAAVPLVPQSYSSDVSERIDSPESSDATEASVGQRDGSQGIQRFAICRVSPIDDSSAMGEINAIREIDDKSVDAFREAINFVGRYMQFDLLQLAFLNLMGHHQVREEMLYRVSNPIGMVRNRHTEIAHMIMTSLFNFCSSIHAVQEHAEAKAMRIGGLQLKKQVHALFAQAYDEGDELFFARKLRDVLVHSDLEIFDYENSFLIEVEGAPPVARATSFFARRALQSQGSFNARLRAWIGEQGDLFEIAPVLEKAFAQLHAMYPAVVSLTDPLLTEHAETVVSISLAILESVGDCDDLILYPATAAFKPDTDNADLLVVLHPEVIAYAHSLFEAEPDDGKHRVV